MLRNNAITCCYGCKDRQMGCHSTCKQYLEEKSKHDTERELLAERRNEEYSKIRDVINGISRMKRGK